MKGSESRNKGGAKLFSLSGVFVEVDESSWGVGGGSGVQMKGMCQERKRMCLLFEELFGKTFLMCCWGRVFHWKSQSGHGWRPCSRAPTSSATPPSNPSVPPTDLRSVTSDPR